MVDRQAGEAEDVLPDPDGLRRAEPGRGDGRADLGRELLGGAGAVELRRVAQSSDTQVGQRVREALVVLGEAVHGESA